MIKTREFYYAVCDGCGEKADYADFDAVATPDQAAEGATDLGWLLLTDARGVESHYCEDCTVWSEEEDCLVPIPPISEAGEQTNG